MRWFSRSELLLGEEALERLRASRVAVFGLGGVGSFAVEALARAGVGHLPLVDHDVVGPSNLNRQLFVGDLSHTRICPLAARVRKELSYMPGIVGLKVAEEVLRMLLVVPET